jgi:hypothetical protein
MAEATTHAGGCHCGAVRYEVTTGLDRVLACNCSHCQRRGLLLTFVPEASFRLQSGGDNLQDYQFNKKVIHHLFCRTCGIESFARGTGPGGDAMVAINVRCLDGIDIGALSPTPFNGRDL